MMIGKDVTASANAIDARSTHSPFHRLRGGYEDAVTALVSVGAYGTNLPQPIPAYAPLITFFGATAGLIDAPHVGYESPSFGGFTYVSEYAPSKYLTDIGGVNKNAYAVTAQFKSPDIHDKITYDARVSYAHNVLNGYPGIISKAKAAQTDALLTIYELVFGDQLNASASVAYAGFDASLSYGYEFASKSPEAIFDSGLNVTTTVTAPGKIKPYILEGTLGRTMAFGPGKVGVMASYAVAKDYARYFDAQMTSSKARSYGAGVGFFVGTLSAELEFLHYQTKSVFATGSNKSGATFSGNIITFGVIYLF